MANFVKSFLIPVVTGIFLQLATNYLNGYLFSNYGANTHHQTASFIFIYSTAWLNLLHAILPGLSVGLLAKSKPALLGFISILLAQLLVGFGSMTYYDPYPIPLINFLSVALPFSFYGLFSSIAGFAIKQKVLTTQSSGTSV